MVELNPKPGTPVWVKRLDKHGQELPEQDWKLVGHVAETKLICKSCGVTPDEAHLYECKVLVGENPYVEKVKPTIVVKEAYPYSGMNPDHIVLDKKDPFESALIQMVKTNRAKRRDYALDGDPFSNFKATSSRMGIAGFGPTESALFNVIQKLERLASLRANGRLENPENETVTDTYLDLAVYAVIMYAIVLNGDK